MRVFVTVVDTQSFSAASKELGMPLPTVSRKIAELENYLGAQLLTRSTRKVAITDSGQRYYDDVRNILDDIGDAERQVSGEYQQPKGRLTVTAPTLFGRLHVLPIVNSFLQAHQHISAELLLSNHVVDLLEEHIDLGVRIGQLSDSSMVAVRVGAVRQVVCASPGYLARYQCPLSPNDLTGHQSILFSKGGVPFAEWQFKMANKTMHFIPGNSRLVINSIEGIVESAIQGGGLIQMYSYQVASHVADGSLRVVLDEYEVDPVPVHLVYPQGRFSPRKVRAFIDFSVPRLRERLTEIETQCMAPQPI